MNDEVPTQVSSNWNTEMQISSFLMATWRCGYNSVKTVYRLKIVEDLTGICIPTSAS